MPQLRLREIKFRAWDPLRKVFDFTLLSLDAGGVLSTPFTKAGIIISQYTGLKDKNGVEIYEGDIVWFEVENADMWSGGSKGFVVYDDDVAAFKLNYDNNPNKLLSIGNGYDAYPGSLKVIGNIYENPELVK